MSAVRRRASAPEPELEPVVVDWPDFAELFLEKHRPGEGVAIVGPTGSGKSTLGVQLCQLLATRVADDGRPARVVVFGTKPRDKTLTALGWTRLREWPPGYGQEHVVVWPRPKDPETAAARQARVFGPVMRAIYAEGGQTVYVDEVAYFEEKPPHGLGLSATMAQYWQSARALDVTLIAGTQRPRNVNRSMWSEPKWLCIFRIDDADDVKRVTEVAGTGVDELVFKLGGHEFLCVHRPAGGTRTLYVSRVRPPRRSGERAGA